MDIGVVGGGINGLCCAWQLQQLGHAVRLYERNRLMAETSSRSSKLLHGGLRYLENLEFRLVREALRERDGWLARVPSLTRPLRLLMPVYRGGRRSRWLIRAGLFLYDSLAGRSELPPATWRTAGQILQADPQLRREGLLGGYSFSDGQMDDRALGLWVAEQAQAAGAVLREHCEVRRVDRSGRVEFADGTSARHERLINVCGPWAERLLEQSGIASPYRLDLVRGSHLVLDLPCPQAYVLEVPCEPRIVFVLPWQGRTLVGTTEVRQALDAPAVCDPSEQDYLLTVIGHYFPSASGPDRVLEVFAGVRPLLHSASNPAQATREYALHRDGALISVFGGKWTTAQALARRVSDHIH
ncbi:FAD-dependent oxidoreductase [Accumulibacter sp.]|uniref:glycerol-3-phosphate dehydrogenase/oxidase n=1 Tax=Accumulibacter sp. TaxID=2053492 RepID=UPI0025DDD16D|nr:FAD-dependent oxidoreductase [Accumulibacter sp.]MCM8612097.1 FAD-dependent oxidoreductase [Accumulibacter sp.]MCM8635763.1 FAD-dependent oxidoreductase [Accumulibacter sp.]MCM8639600.1 FAD-dependent oxidoreductase [Accumulibacter sp.]